MITTEKDLIQEKWRFYDLLCKSRIDYTKQILISLLLSLLQDILENDKEMSKEGLDALERTFKKWESEE